MATTTISMDEIFKLATEAAIAARMADIEKHGNDYGSAGFAWVKLPKPARGPFISWCKEQIAKAVEGCEPGPDMQMAHQRATGIYGELAHRGGWEIWAPGMDGYTGQSVDTKEKAARAFAEVLNQHGIVAYAQSRMD